MHVTEEQLNNYITDKMPKTEPSLNKSNIAELFFLFSFDISFVSEKPLSL